MNTNVLIISNNIFSKITNNGKTLESIFANVDKNSISQLYFTDKTVPDFDFCNNYFRILDHDVFRNVFLNRQCCGCVIKRNSSFILKESSNIKSRILSVFESNHSFLRLGRDILWSLGSWKTKALNDWVIKQNPDYIFFVVGGAKFSHKITIYFSDFLHVPLVTFFTDDYLIFPKRRNIFDYLQHYRMKKFYKMTVGKSSLCFAIGDYMCETYSNYFSKSFYPIMNSVNIKKYFLKDETEKEVVINYFGSIHTNRWKMIVKFAELLNLSIRKDICLNVYTATKPEKEILKAFSNCGVNFKGGILGNDLHEAMSQSDILLHIESDDIYSKSLTKLSISTKIPEYLISGRPILGFGPRDIASMKLLIEQGIGIVISPTDLNFIQLEKILTDFSFREELGKSGYDYAVENFDKSQISCAFNKKIEQIINSS